MIEVPFSYLRFLPQDFLSWSEEAQQKWLDQLRAERRQQQANYVERKKEDSPDYIEQRRAYARKYYAENKEKCKEANRRCRERKKEEWLKRMKP